MSNTVKRFRKYNEDYDDSKNTSHDYHRHHLSEKRLRAALRSKTKSTLLDLIENEDY
jgi:hypothetical protein